MSSVDPTPPLPPAEPGWTTSEFAGLVGLFVSALITLLVAFGVHLTDQQRAAILGIVPVALALGVSVYALARSWRKRGTPG